MPSGYLVVQGHPAHPGRARLLAGEDLPQPEQPGSNGPSIVYCARFNDIETAMMHAHLALCRKLVDIDAHLYRTSPLEAAAAVDALALRHRVIQIDPAVESDPKFDELVQREKRRAHRVARLCNTVGIAAIVLLILNLLLVALSG